MQQTEERPLVPLTVPFAGVFSESMAKKHCKAYFQVLLQIKTLFDRGLTKLIHTAPASYYEVLLRAEFPNTVGTHEKHDIYEEMLKVSAAVAFPNAVREDDGFVNSDDGASRASEGSEGSECVFPDEDDVHDPPPPSGDSAGFVCSEHGEEAVDKEEEEAPPAPEEDSSSSSSSSSEASDSEDGFLCSPPPEEDEEDVPPLPAFPFSYGGVRFRLEDHRHKNHPGRVDPTIVATCLSKHPKCEKRHGVGRKNTRLFGEWEPVAWLLAWSRKGHAHASKQLHMKDAPSMAEIAVACGEMRAAFV